MSVIRSLLAVNSFGFDQSRKSHGSRTLFWQTSQALYTSKSSKEVPDFPFSELSRQWQDFKFPDEELPKPVISKQHAVETDLGTLSAQGVSSATADPIRPSSARYLELEIRLTEIQKEKLALVLEVLRVGRADGSTDVNTEDSSTLSAPEKTRKK